MPENRRKAMASDLQVAIARFVQDNYADSNAFGDLISPRAPSVVSSRIMQARSLVRRGDLDFEVHFNSGREMTDFMEELMAVMKPFAKISNIRYSHHEWQRCEHGRYYSDAWGVGMTACVDCVRTGAKAWLPRK